jgi:hypothetical protein
VGAAGVEAAVGAVFVAVEDGPSTQYAYPSHRFVHSLPTVLRLILILCLKSAGQQTTWIPLEKLGERDPELGLDGAA